MISKAKIKLNNIYAANWNELIIGQTKAWIRGNLYSNGKFIRNEEKISIFKLIASCLKEKNTEKVKNILSQLNGFFSFVIDSPEFIFATVDRVRSIPLFYGQNNESLILSDNADCIRNSMNISDIKEIARSEFLFTGYVTGPETLLHNVYQIQAGEFLYFCRTFPLQKDFLYRYYNFFHIEPNKKSFIAKDAYLFQLDKVAELTIKRLIEYASGRQIVLPLSAGYDSRLLISLLHRLGYKNVLTFSYGIQGNYESIISKKVADSFYYDWTFVEYNKKLWQQWWQSHERAEFQMWASNWTSLPHYQDWPAVWKLKDSGKIHNDAVFAPGHTGDFISGGHIPSDVQDMTEFSSDCFSKEIIKKHYSLKRWNIKDRKSVEKWHDRIINHGECSQIESGQDLANCYEKWEWQERQAKFIVNSVRVYEYWGYDWYLPLWDRDFMEFWEKVPLHLRVNKCLYNSFIEINHNQSRIKFGDKIYAKRIPKPMLQDIRPIRNTSFLHKLYRFYVSLKKYYMQPMGIYGIHTLYYYLKNRPININSVIASSYISEVTEKKQFIDDCGDYNKND